MQLLQKKEIQISIIIFAFLGISYGVWFFNKKSKKSDTIFKTEHPQPQSITQYVSASGTLKAKDQILVGSLVAGKVEKIYVDDNDIVKKGQLLVALDNGIGDSSVKEAKAALSQAKSQEDFESSHYLRQKQLYQAGQLSDQQFDQITHQYRVAQAKVLQAQAQLEKAEKQFKNLSVTSPADGVIIAKKVNLGQMITSQLDATVLFEIAKDLKEMEAHVDIDEADVGMVKEGQPVYFAVDALPNASFTSKIRQIRYQATNNDNVITYNAIIDVNNPEHILRPGMTTNVDINVANKKEVIAVPNKAFRINSLKLKAFALQKKYTFNPLGKEQKKRQRNASLWTFANNTIQEMAVETGSSNEKFTEIKKGITTSSNVITEFFTPTDATQFLKKFFRG